MGEGESEQAAEPHAADEDPERCRGDQVIARDKPRPADPGKLRPGSGGMPVRKD